MTLLLVALGTLARADVPRPPRLPPRAVSLEFTVNEAANSPYQSPERRSFEQLLRRLVSRKYQPAVLILHSYGWWNSFGDGVDRGLFYQQPELQLTAFSHVRGGGGQSSAGRAHCQNCLPGNQWTPGRLHDGMPHTCMRISAGCHAT